MVIQIHSHYWITDRVTCFFLFLPQWNTFDGLKMVIVVYLCLQHCLLSSSAVGRSFTAVQMELASQSDGGVMGTKTVRMGVMRGCARAPRGCVTPRPSSPVKTQVMTSLAGYAVAWAGLCSCSTCIILNNHCYDSIISYDAVDKHQIAQRLCMCLWHYPIH